MVPIKGAARSTLLTDCVIDFGEVAANRFPDNFVCDGEATVREVATTPKHAVATVTLNQIGLATRTSWLGFGGHFSATLQHTQRHDEATVDVATCWKAGILPH